MADVALASVIVAGVVGVVSPAFAAYGQGRQRRHGRELVDLQELRAVLDDALAAAREARAVLLAQSGGELDTPKLRETSSGLGLMSSRLAIRLGEAHDVAITYQTLMDAFYTWVEIFENLEELLDKTDDDEINAALVEADNQFMEAQGRYTESARRLVGSRVPKARLPRGSTGFS
jgi:hypothetical protein